MPNTSVFQKIPFCKLLPAKDNIRKYRDEAADDDLASDETDAPDDVSKALPAGLPAKTRAMASSIYHNGLLQPLGVYPSKDKPGYFHVHFGNRRYDAIAALVKARLRKRAWEVNCRVSTEEAALAEALSENVMRQPMNPLDECDAFRKLLEDEGRTVEEIAAQFGTTKKAVEKRLRLTRLHPDIAQAYRDRKLDLAAVYAFACTEDQTLQLKTWNRLKAAPWNLTPNSIRREILSDGVNSNHPLALFVGREAYLGAGGHIEPALFVEAETWRDQPLLERLATEKLEAMAADLTARGVYRQVRVIASLEGAPSYEELDGLKALPTETFPLTEADQANQARLMQRLEALSELDELSDEEVEEYENAQAELEKIEASTVGYSTAVQAEAIAFLGVDDDGVPQIYRRLYQNIVSEAQAEDGAASDVALLPSSGQPDVPGGAMQPQKPKGYPRSLVYELADQRRFILGIGLSRSPDLAYDCLVFILASQLMGKGAKYLHGLGFELTAKRAARASLSPPTGSTAAADALENQLSHLDLAWMEAESTAACFARFRSLSAAAKADILAHCMAIMCKPSACPDACAEGTLHSHFHETLGILMGLEIRDWLPLTATGFWVRLTKQQIMQALDDIGAGVLKSGYADQNKGALAESMERLFSGKGHVPSEISDRARAWAPAVLRFAADLAAHEAALEGGEQSGPAMPEAEPDLRPSDERNAASPDILQIDEEASGPPPLEDAA